MIWFLVGVLVSSAVWSVEVWRLRTEIGRLLSLVVVMSFATKDGGT